MNSYQRLGDVPRKRHILHKREPSQSYKGEGMYYEHVVTTEGFDRAYSIRYHLRPPTRVKNVKVAGHVPLEFSLANAAQCRVRVAGRDLSPLRRDGAVSHYRLTAHAARPLEALCQH